MKITKQELKQIIKEETQRALNEWDLSGLIDTAMKKGEEFLASPIGQRVSSAAEKVARQATRLAPPLHRGAGEPTTLATDALETLEWTLKTLNPVLLLLSKYQHVIGDEDKRLLQGLLKHYTTNWPGKHTTTLPIKDPSQIQDPLAR